MNSLNAAFQSLVEQQLPRWRYLANEAWPVEADSCCFWAVQGQGGGWSLASAPLWASQAVSFGQEHNIFVACGRWGESIWECRYDPATATLYWRRDDGFEPPSHELNWPDREGIEAILRQLPVLLTTHAADSTSTSAAQN